jgi:surface polysaccharide O-acyltransferase-like enzyme
VTNVTFNGAPFKIRETPSLALDRAKQNNILTGEAFMKFKGVVALTNYVPELNSAGGKLRIVLYEIGLFILVTAYFIITDNIPTWSIDSQIVIIALGFLVLGLFFSRRPTCQKKYGELAYRNAFAHYAMPGLGFILGAIAHAGYMNGLDYRKQVPAFFPKPGNMGSFFNFLFTGK